MMQGAGRHDRPGADNLLETGWRTVARVELQHDRHRQHQACGQRQRTRSAVPPREWQHDRPGLAPRRDTGIGARRLQQREDRGRQRLRIDGAAELRQQPVDAAELHQPRGQQLVSGNRPGDPLHLLRRELAIDIRGQHFVRDHHPAPVARPALVCGDSARRAFDRAARARAMRLMMVPIGVSSTSAACA